jgi:hypothetical protein
MVFEGDKAFPYPCLLPRPKMAVNIMPAMRAIARIKRRISDLFILLSSSSRFQLPGSRYYRCGH